MFPVNLTAATPQIEVNVDPQKASKYGMTAFQVAQNLRIIYSGIPAVTTLTINSTKLDVNLYYGTPATTIDAIRDERFTILGTAKVGDPATVTDAPGPTEYYTYQW